MNPVMVPPGDHPYDPLNRDIDPLAFALAKVQTHLLWIDEHRGSFEAARQDDPETAERELGYMRLSIKDAIIYLKRLSELVLAGYVIDQDKRLPKGLITRFFERRTTDV
jgi:hypothetical protein